MSSNTSILRALLLLFFLTAPDLQAQEVKFIPLDNKRICISSWKSADGLPTWHIYDIVQDKNGLIWMGTEAGLVSLDGKHFQMHPVDADAPIRQNIKRILIDGRQNLWLFSQTAKGNLVILIYDPFQKKTYSLTDYTGANIPFSNRAVASLFKADGKIFISDPISGIGGYFDQQNKWQETLRIAPAQSPSKTVYFPAANQNYWILNLADQTLDLISPVGTQLNHYNWPANLHLTEYKMGTDQKLYLFGAIKGLKDTIPKLFRCEESAGCVQVPENEKFTLTWRAGANFSFKPSPVWSNNKEGINMVFYNKTQLALYDHHQPIFTAFDSLFALHSPNQLESRIFNLPDGSFWLIGINVLIRIAVFDNHFTTYFKDLTFPPSTRGLVRYQNHLLVNSYSGFFDIDLLSRRSKKLSTHQSRGLALHSNILWNSKGNQAIHALSLPSFKEIYFEEVRFNGLGELCEVFVAKNGTVYTGSETALLYKQKSASAFQKHEQVTGITFHENQAGVWVGGNHGLWLLDSSSNIVKHFSEEIFPTGTSVTINDIHEDKEGLFWLATEIGLLQWKPFSREVKSFSLETGHLASNLLNGILEDRQNRLWISSQNGLICFDKKRNRFYTLSHLDGLPSNEFNKISFYQDSTGCMYFGGINGIISFNPDQIAMPDQSNRIQLRSVILQFSNSIIPARDLSFEAILGNGGLLIPNDMGTLEIRYAVLSYLKEPVQYRWRIPEIDSTWHYTTEPNFLVFGLPSGVYTLEFGIYSPGNSHLQQSISLSLEVEPPLYLKPWFLGFLLVLVLLLIFLVTSIRQRQLFRLSRRLAKEVSEKTAQLKKERDIIANQNLELARLNDEKNRFFQDLSHEFRNPLTLIISPVNDLLKQEELPAGNRLRLEQVRRNARKILNLIDEILELSHLDTGVIQAVDNVITPFPFIHRICMDFESTASGKGINLQLIHTLPESLQIHTDAKKLEKILINLIQNALKFTPSGGSVQVKAQWIAPGYLDIWVNDTGIGIPSEHQDKIFDRFYQIPSGKVHSGKGGFGIGLSICKHYAQLMGGDIMVYSRPGEGTNMHLTVPCKKAREKSSTPVIEEPVEIAPEGTALLPPQTPCILIVDDQPEMQEYVAALLADRYKLLKASSAAQALRVLRQEKVDLMICDIMMPDKSGLVLVNEIRQEEAFQQLSVVFLSGVHNQHFSAEAERLGVKDVFQKPVQESLFVQAISRILSEKSNPNHRNQAAP